MRDFDAGCLAFFKDLTPEQYKYFILQLSDTSTYKLDILKNLINDDVKFLMICDIFAGENLCFPNRKLMFQTFNKAFMYDYVKKRDFSETSFELAAKIFNDKIPTVKNKVLRLVSLEDGDKYESLKKEQEKLTNKRRKIRDANKKKKDILLNKGDSNNE
jgi:hypothetical protein